MIVQRQCLIAIVLLAASGCVDSHFEPVDEGSVDGDSVVTTTWRGELTGAGNCKWDVVGNSDFQSNPIQFTPDGQVTYGMTHWYEDDVFACYYSNLYPSYLSYFPGCDFDGSGVVEMEEVYDILYKAVETPTGGVPMYSTPCPSDCPADFNGDGIVGFADQTEFLAHYGKCATSVCPWDFDGDGIVGFADWTTFLAAYGSCSDCPADFNGDGIVGFADEVEFNMHQGPCATSVCPWDLDGDGTVGWSDRTAFLAAYGPCDG